VPQAAPALATWVFGSAFATTIVNTILINVALGALSKALAKKPRSNTPPINVSIRNPVENRRLLFGTVRAGGVFAFYDVSGSHNQFLWYVIVYAGHQCADIRDVWMDTQRIADSTIAGGSSAGGNVTSGFFADKLAIYKHLGTSAQTVNPELNAALPSEWTANHRLQGCTYVVVKMERDDEAYPQGAPQNVTALIDGALLYDHRKDSTSGGSGTHRKDDPRTWEFGTIGSNPVLQWYWYVTGGSVHNDQSTRLIKYGLEEVESRIDDSYVIAAANKCDEVLSGSVAPPSGSQPRYRGNLEISVGETHREIIESLLSSFAGTQVVVHGKHRVFAGTYNSPIHTLSSTDLYGPLEVEDTFDHGKRYNAVAGVLRDAEKDYVEQTTIFRTDAGYETQDNDERIELEIDLRAVTDQAQAQRLCEIKLRKSRMMRSVKLIGGLNLLNVALNETLTFSHPRYDWSGRIFRCIERQFDFSDEAGRVVLTCQREDSGVYADMLTADYQTGTSDTDVFTNEQPDPPSNVRTTGQLNAILVEYDKPSLMFPGTRFEGRMSTASSMTSPTTVYEGPDLQFVIPRVTTDPVYFQVRSIRKGELSDWVPPTNGVLGKAKAIDAALGASVSPGSASSNTGSASQTTNSVTVTAFAGTSPYTYAWTFASGGSGITINSPTADTTSFTSTSLTEGENRTGQARCTVTDNVAATYTIDVDVDIERLAASITAPSMTVVGTANANDDASCAFKIDNDGHWYSSDTSAAPTTDRGLWSDPVDYAGNYQVRFTRTAGVLTAFSSGSAMNTWLALTTGRDGRVDNTINFTSVRDIVFTIEIRRASDSVVVSTSTGNRLSAEVSGVEA
jgi:hypothetical protein